MDATARKPFQGVVNIIRFNWHFYVIACSLITSLMVLNAVLPLQLQTVTSVALLLISLSILLSLIISFYIYDYSGLYRLQWLPINGNSRLLNVNAGFDETSFLIKKKFPGVDMNVIDFYDPQNHTEISIKRARRAFNIYPGTRLVSTTHLHLEPHSADYILAVFSVHEIRDSQERIAFFRQLRTTLKPGGKIIVVEHLRDIPNFVAYNIGFLHFFSKREWLNTFRSAGLRIDKEQKITYFLSLFMLEPDGNAA